MLGRVPGRGRLAATNIYRAGSFNIRRCFREFPLITWVGDGRLVLFGCAGVRERVKANERVRTGYRLGEGCKKTKLAEKRGEEGRSRDPTRLDIKSRGESQTWNLPHPSPVGNVRALQRNHCLQKPIQRGKPFSLCCRLTRA
jgi:hypothetical protein